MESVVKDFNVDDALRKYMYELEQCTTDISQAPPPLQELEPIADLLHPTSIADAELYDALFPSAIHATSAAPLYRIEQADLLEQEAVNDNYATTITKRTEAWTAKNRRAQKRFRERQKVLQQSWFVDNGSFCKSAADQMVKELRRLKKGKWSNSC